MILGSCLDAIATLSKDCIERIHLLESKSDLRTLWQSKLAFSLEQTLLFAKLGHEMECLGGHTDDDRVYFTMLNNCTGCFQTTLTDSNIRVQAIGLQVLKGMAQRGTNVEDNAFLMFFAGELVKDIFVIILKTLKKPVSKESAAIAIECLRLLVVLQTVSKDLDCQRGYVSLFLEATVMIITAQNDGYSQEFNDLRSTAIRLVSHIAQIPSLAVHFKNALLSMPLVHRQQLQEVIRASVSQDQSAIQAKAATPSLGIRLPLPTGESREKIFQLPPTVTYSNNDNMEENEDEEEDEEDDDDWDAFQSFPASANAAGVDSKVESISEETVLVEKNSSVPEVERESDLFQEAVSQSPNNTRDASDTTQEDVEDEVISETPGGQMASHGSIPYDGNVVEEPIDSRTSSGLAEPSDDDQHDQGEEEATLNKEKEEGAGSTKVTEQITSDLDPIGNNERSAVSKDQELIKENSDDESEPGPVDTTPLDKGDDEDGATG
ncbi:hypothetical protein TIFTF001_026181 [Ficus carica]|uniref:Uncharacterized protein n=1 Tax=Ficus carica TaxID=3494 RepID=A0AA88IT18_FICCA|nr:hypothetical protein TIFTF001_026181 [Ficus carica]